MSTSTDSLLFNRRLIARMRLQDVWITLLLFGAVMVAWWFVTRVTDSVDFYASPGAIAADLLNRVHSGKIWTDLWATTKRVVPNLVLGTVAGYAAALWLAVYAPRLRYAVFMLSVLMFGFSTIAVFYLLKMWLPIGEAPKLVFVFYIAFETQFVPVFFWAANLMAGEGSRAEIDQLEAARSMGASRWHLLSRHLCYQASPISYAAFIMSARLSWALTVVVEVYAHHRDGLGYSITESSETFDVAGVFSNALVVAALTLCTIVVGGYVYRRLSRGRM